MQQKRKGGLIPSVEWLTNYQRQWFSCDVVAGLTASAVVIPKAMAFAVIAGLPVQVGLYTALVPMIIYALLGTSRPLSVTTTTTIAILMATQLSTVITSNDQTMLLTASATLAVLVGVILMLASALRLGFVANFISEPVLIGFKSGIGLVIIVDQLPKLLGLHISASGFLRKIAEIITTLPETSLLTLALSVGILLLIFCLEHFTPRAPTPLIVIVIAVLISSIFGLDRLGISTVGHIPSGLPSLTWPHIDLVESLWPGAVGIALMSFTESIAAARAFMKRGEPQLEANQELLALGAANLAGGFFGAMPAGGGTTQTAVNRLAGAKTQLSEVITAVVTLGTLLLLAPLIAPMPHATLAAVVIAYSIELIKPAEFYEIRQVRRTEYYWALIALIGVILLGTLKGIVVAVVMSLLSLAQQVFNPGVYIMARKRNTGIFRPVSPDHPDDETFPGLLLVRVEGRIFFANVQIIGDKVWSLIEQTNPKVMALDCSAIFDLEYTALKMLIAMEERLSKEGITLWMVAMNIDVYQMVKNSPLGETLGEGRMILNRQTAVEKYQALQEQPTIHGA